MSEIILEETSTEELSDLLEKIPPRVVVGAIAEENDADLAIFLLTLQRASSSTAKHAAQILAQLPFDKQVSVAEKIAATEIVESERVKEVYTRLVDQIMTAAKRTTVFGDGASNLAKLLSRMRMADQNRLLESLATKQPELVNTIHERIFTFDELVNLSDDAIRTILRVLDPSTVALALHKTPAKIKEKFLQNMSAESAASVEKEMDQLTFEQTQIADTARQSVVDLVRKFAAKGLLAIDRESDGEREV